MRIGEYMAGKVRGLDYDIKLYMFGDKYFICCGVKAFIYMHFGFCCGIF